MCNAVGLLDCLLIVSRSAVVYRYHYFQLIVSFVRVEGRESMT